MSTSKLMRVWFAFVGIILWSGIYLTGFSDANWLLYVPATGFVFSAITGICTLFGFRIKETSDH